MKKTPATLAKEIECAMYRASKDWARYGNEHCAVYEKDLECICPKKDKDRKKKLRSFAEEYGFRLRFYLEGACAIFGKRASTAANGARALWLPVTLPGFIGEGPSYASSVT